MNKSHLIHLAGSTALILALGLVIGYGAGYFQGKHSSFTGIEAVGEINPGVTTLQFMKVENGHLIGRIEGQHARLVYSSDHLLELEKGDDFSVPLSEIDLIHFFVAEDLPEGTQFIASKSGKYYYSIFDKKAFNLTPANRIYFQSAQEAEERGYLWK